MSQTGDDSIFAHRGREGAYVGPDIPFTVTQLYMDERAYYRY